MNLGEGRNRTEPSPTASLNTLIYKAILTLILQGFKHFLPLSGLTRQRIRRRHPTYSVIEEIVEGFVEGILTKVVLFRNPMNSTPPPPMPPPRATTAFAPPPNESSKGSNAAASILRWRTHSSAPPRKLPSTSNPKPASKWTTAALPLPSPPSKNASYGCARKVQPPRCHGNSGRCGLRSLGTPSRRTQPTNR